MQANRGFVQQVQIRVTDQSAREGGALLLATGNGGRVFVQHVGDFQHRSNLFNFVGDVGSGNVFSFQREGNIVAYGDGWVQGVSFERHRHIALHGGQHVDFATADADLTAADSFESCHHAQGGGFTTTGGP